MLDYWLQHKHGADFIVIDRGLVDFHDTNAYAASEVLSLTPHFAAVAQQVRGLTSLPIWWAEDGAESSANWDFQAATLGSMLYHELVGGSAVSLRWQPQGVAGGPNGGNNHNLFSDTRQSGGGQPYPAYWTYKAFHDYFRAGTALYRTTISSPDIEVLSSAAQTMLINKRPGQIRIQVNNVTVVVPGYAVLLMPTPPAVTSAASASPIEQLWNWVARPRR